MAEWTEKEWGPLRDMVFRLCAAPGTPGDEEEAAKAVEKEVRRCLPGAQIQRDTLGNLLVYFGDRQAPRQVLLDAHMDQIGMIVTRVEDSGFLRLAPCGGVDRRVLPGSVVTVHGKEPAYGIVCCKPPHLSNGDADKVPAVDQMFIDLGQDAETVKQNVSPGDRITLGEAPRALLGSRITAAGLDNRAGVAALLRCAELLQGKTLSCGGILLFSSREETGCEGAATGSFQARPTEAVVVDVTFATQPGVAAHQGGKLGGGVMIGASSTLNRRMTQRLRDLAKEKEIPSQVEVMGGRTDTNADAIGVSREGVPTALLSIPLRYMHTPVEVIDLEDLEGVARLLAAYVLEGGENRG